MGGLLADVKGVRVPCGGCGRINRIPWSRLEDTGKCGQCGAPLPAPASPVEIPDAATYDAMISGSALPVLVDYWAEWCGPCRSVAPEIEKVAAARAGRLLVAKLNTEAVPAVAQREGIMSIPTMALYQGGRRAARESGARPAHEIEAFIRKALGGNA